MPKYLVKVSYAAECATGLLQDGGRARRVVAQGLVESLGGELEASHFAYVPDDALVICDLPDAASSIAASLAINASGAVRSSTTPLITPEEIDAAAKKSPTYRALGA
jgi:uncharacterized protein with GYD domain